MAGLQKTLTNSVHVLLTKYGLRETPSDLPEQRTAWNVRDSNATLLIGRAELSKGTLFTKLCAELIFLRPFHVVDLEARDALYLTSHWVTSLIEELRANEFCLNVAGPRESESRRNLRGCSHIHRRTAGPILFSDRSEMSSAT